jgi:hypothetical protein
MIPRPKELASRPGPKGAKSRIESDSMLEFGKPEQKKAARRSVPPNSQTSDLALAEQATFPVLRTNRR